MLGIGVSPTGSPAFGHLASNGSSSSLATTATLNSSPSTAPTTPLSATSAASASVAPQSVPLKETRFYKRALLEDIEPTLRLDTAPGLSWLARRTVLNAMMDGSLMVEPVPTGSKPLHHSCSLCGERRKGEEHARRHRFRTSESDSAQRYPLCSYCLNRVRAVCDFLGFLRQVRDGHWRVDGLEAERLAWEESVRLRERMFWARMGGGVVPAFLDTRTSPRSSTEESKKTSVEVTERTNESDEEFVPPPRDLDAPDDPFHSQDKRVSIGTKVISVDDKPNEAVEKGVVEEDEQSIIDQQLNGEAVTESRKSVESTESETSAEPSTRAESPAPKKEQRLSLSIPGSFT